jgi:hypothetical protein
MRKPEWERGNREGNEECSSNQRFRIPHSVVSGPCADLWNKHIFRKRFLRNLLE